MIMQNIPKILKLLDEHYPPVKCFLDYETDWQLLIATILSARCTDDRVNLVTKSLFKKYPALIDFADADIYTLENDVKSTGFYRNKAKHIKHAAAVLLTEFGGKVPSDIEKLTKLPGVGRKTANVIRCHIYNIPSIVVDTHVMRLSNRFGFVKSSDPVKIEMELYKILPVEHYIRYNAQLIAHGRAVCKAPSPKCGICFLREFCEYESGF
jgi:endonuclease-3